MIILVFNYNQYVVDLYLKEVQESISKLILQMIKTFGNIL